MKHCFSPLYRRYRKSAFTAFGGEISILAYLWRQPSTEHIKALFNDDAISLSPSST